MFVVRCGDGCVSILGEGEDGGSLDIVVSSIGECIRESVWVV